MALMVYILVGLGAVGLCFAAPVVSEDDQPRADSDRITRSLDQQSPNIFDPQADQMVDWNSVYDKRMPHDLTKRRFGDQAYVSKFGYPSPNSLQDWSSTFGRNYRSFGNHIPTFGEHAGLRPEDLQNWRNFMGSFAKRREEKRGLGNSQNPRFGSDLRPSELQNWRAFFSAGSRHR